MKFLLSKQQRDKSHILEEFNSAMMVTRYDDIMAHNRLIGYHYHKLGNFCV